MTPAYPERLRDRGESRLGRLALDRTSGNPYDQRVIVRAPDAIVCRAGAHPDDDPHDGGGYLQATQVSAKGTSSMRS